MNPDQPEQETRPADQANSEPEANKIVSYIAIVFFYCFLLLSPLLPPFFLVDRIIRFFVLDRKTYDIGFIGQCCAVIGCVLWPAFLWWAYDTGFFNDLILEKIWEINDHPITKWIFLSIIILLYGFKLYSYCSNSSILNHKENFLLHSFSLSFIMFIIVRLLDIKLHHIFKYRYGDFIKWTSIVSFLLTIYNFITSVTYLVVLSLNFFEYKFLSQKKYTIIKSSKIVYWVNGLKDSVDYILGSLLLLFAREFFLHLFPQPEYIKDFGFRTFVSLFICSILWLIKTYVILLWEGLSISNYNDRLETKIVIGSNQLYFLTLFGENKSHPFNFRQKQQFKDYFLYVTNHTGTLYRAKQMVKLLLEQKNNFLKKNVIETIINRLNESINNMKKDETLETDGFASGSQTINNYLTQNISKEDLENFDLRLKKDGFEDTTYQNITVPMLRNWMEKARNNYLRIANTLSRQQEVVDCLDKIMSLGVLLASLVIWLHLTGTSTANVILIIASPIVIGNFMFREMWKTMITGIMFVYFMHPFDVGDLCNVHDEMMEVTSVGLWSTTFEKVETQEEVICSNSDLSNKKIINHNKTGFDWNDYKEFNVGSLKAENVENLKVEIADYLDDETKFTKRSVELLTTGNDIKIAAKFRHNPRATKLTYNNSYYELWKKKCELRSEFVLRVQRLLDEHKDGKCDGSCGSILKVRAVPAIVQKDVYKVIDVRRDGNCGFRCVSHFYSRDFEDEERWSMIRNMLLTEIKGHRDTYKKIYGVHLDNDENESSNKQENMVDSAIERIDWDKPNGDAPPRKWMDKDDLFAVATRFNYAIIFYVKYETTTDKKEVLSHCTTILPLRANVGVMQPEAELAIAFVNNNHYVRLIMKYHDYPLPPIDTRWSDYKDDSVKDWDMIYTDRLDRWNKEASI